MTAVPAGAQTAMIGNQAVLIVYPEAVPYLLTLWGATEEFAEAKRNFEAVEAEEDAIGPYGAAADLLDGWWNEAYHRFRETRRALIEASTA